MGQALFHLGFNHSGHGLLQTYAAQVPQDPEIMPYLQQPLSYHEPIPHSPPQVSGVLILTRDTPWNQTLIQSVIHKTPELQELWIVAAPNSHLRSWLDTLSGQSPVPFKLMLVQEPNHPASLNQAVALCQGSYVAILKDQAVIPMGWLAQLLQALNTNPWQMVGWGATSISTTHALRHETVASSETIFEEYAQQQAVYDSGHLQNQGTFSLGGWLMAIETWQRVGGWSPYQPVDAIGATEWCQRAAKNGIQVGTVPGMSTLDLAQVEPWQSYQAQLWGNKQPLIPKHWSPQTPCLITIP